MGETAAIDADRKMQPGGRMCDMVKRSTRSKRDASGSIRPRHGTGAGRREGWGRGGEEERGGESREGKESAERERLVTCDTGHGFWEARPGRGRCGGVDESSGL